MTADTTPTYSVSCFGCLPLIVSIILLVWVLTHITEINAALDRIVR